MVKGCERRVVVYKANDSKYFYEAYFFMKPEVCDKSYKKTDIMEEANRIIKESVLSSQRESKKKAFLWVLRVGILVFCCVLSSVVTYFVTSNL